jgi:MFS family permease
VAQGALLLLLPLDGLAQGGIFAGFAVPGMLGVGTALVNVPGAMAVTRFGHRRVMTTGLAAAALGGVVMAVVPTSVPLMALAALVCGLGMGVWGLARLTYLAEAVPIERRGRVISAVGGVYRLGMLIGPALTGFGADAWGRSAVLFGTALLNALSWLLIVLLLPQTPPAASSSAGAPTQNPFGLVARVAREHGHVLATAGVAMWALALLRSARLLLLPICGTVMGLDPAQVGLIKSWSAAADALLFYPVGLAMDRLGRKWTAVPCLLLLSLGVLTIAWADSYAMLVVGGLIAGFGNGMGSGINMTLAGDFAPAKGRAEFIGVWRLWSDAGAAVAPFVMGTIAELLVLSAAGAVTAGLGLAGMLVMAYAVREPLGHEPLRREPPRP